MVVVVEEGGARAISKDGTSSPCVADMVRAGSSHLAGVARAGTTRMICATEADSPSLCTISALPDRCFNVILGHFPSIFI